MRLNLLLLWLAAQLLHAEDHLQHFSLSHFGHYAAMLQADGSAWIVDANSGSKKMIMKAGPVPVEFAWSPDDRSLFVTHTGKISIFSVPKARQVHSLTGISAVSLADVSPDGHYISYLQGGNLWVSSSDGQNHKRLTDGGNGNLLLGLPDLVFGKEFGVSKHYWWSHDSSSIAYIETVFKDDNHYLVAGAKSPLFRLKTVDVTSGKIQTVFESTDEWPYILRVAWHPDGKKLFFYRMNRLQQLAELCFFEEGAIKTFLTEKDGYWINAPETPIFLDKGEKIVVSSERTGDRHLYSYLMDGQLQKDLTPNNLEVYRLFSATDDHSLFAIASGGMHQEQHLFHFSLDDTPPQQITKEPGWHELILDASGDAYIDYYSSAKARPCIEWYATDKKPIELSASQTDEQPVANEFFTIKTHDDIQLPARLFKPDDFDSKKKYPLIIYTFSGPRSRVVMDQWGDWQMAWNRSMVRQGFLVLAVDTRGSGGYGHLYEEYIHYRLGAQETVDLREVVSYLRRQPYVDGNRLGIWGCGYGAHTVVHAMWQFPGGFKAGFADSPIADWRKYDGYFTERYLGLPEKRFNEYEDSGPLHDARRMTGTLMVTTDPKDSLIGPDHVEALKNAMAHLKKNPEVAQRFHVIDMPDDLSKLMAQMTNFFKSTL